MSDIDSIIVGVTRQQLSQIFNNNPRLISAFEELFRKSFVTTPQKVEGITLSADNQFGYAELLGMISTVVEPIVSMILVELAGQLYATFDSQPPMQQDLYPPPAREFDMGQDFTQPQPPMRQDLYQPPVDVSDLAGQQSNRVKITGGTIDGVTIGQTQQQSAKFTSASLTAANAGFEIGSTSAANTPYIDFHSSGNNIDYDARIIALGGSAVVGQGSLNFSGASFNFGGKIVGSNPTLMETSSNLSDNTGSSTATLLNAPSAGNPTKWIAINDNGTIRRIPTW